MILDVKNITKFYHGTPVLQQIDLSLEAGEFLALLGPSGAGKSTLMRILVGLETADSGQAHLADTALLPLPANRRPVGIVFQHYALFPHMDVRRNIHFALKLRRPRFNHAQRQREFGRLCQLCHVEPAWHHRYPAQLSGGQQQRVAIARALASAPRLLLLDEPFSALDAQLRRQTREQLLQTVKQEGVTTILITHDQEEATQMADRIAVMLGGRIQQMAKPQQLYQQPANREVALFLGQAELFDDVGMI